MGDNIANVSTIGFKGGRADFQDVLGGVASNGQRVGQGTRMNGPELLMGQGALQQTGRSLDLAIRGQGFFAVRGNHDGIDGMYYGRDGRFGLDGSGFVVDGEGLRLQGYAIDGSGAISSVSDDLRLDLSAAPMPTGTVNLAAQLNSASPAGVFVPADPAGSSQYSTSVTVYDSLGAPHKVDVHFVNNGAGSWDWHAMVDGGELQGGVAGTPTEIGSGNLTFNTDGSLQTETGGPITATFANASAQTITLDFGDAIAAGGTGLSGSTQFAQASSVKSTSQDGYPAGNLVDLAVAEDGKVTARFSNGTAREVAQVALALFGSEESLRRAGGQLFSTTNESGDALIGAVGSGGRGAVSGGALETSNVDLGAELVTLIAYQRAFQANARTVTTADEMLAELNNLKR